MADFANLLKELRKNHCLTQLELAQKIGVDFTYVCRIEKGKIPAYKIVTKIAEVLNTDVNELSLAAGYIPKDFETLIFNNKLARDFIKILPKLNAEERAEIQELINSVKERNNEKV